MHIVKYVTTKTDSILIHIHHQRPLNRLLVLKLLIFPHTFQQVSHEKQLTETKWKEEKKRRINTEKRLRLAEDSLKRLDRALRDSGVQIDLQIETDVKNLKGSFTSPCQVSH